ncbi:hypothetical protein C8E05_1573 [Rhodococcus wratislaviensis]|uniref:Helix-turn-helix domain-containing protein n=1 Tax=Rhodococcus wratislaviensis TaxID=44752 RepID=A0AB38FGP6_RHOWR|nr:helix-turn-helix domain-containing protein [Rhodococcus wratislaviensis]REE72185.1 hypothetical protein C8E05_1573 [Rhodococcus wratislaviensis]SPZ40799.1 Uncharacterised protein [Rhodococcus wratislaviensis]
MTAAPSKKFSKLVWLKSLDGVKFTLSEYRVLISLFNHSNEYGYDARPKIKTIAEEIAASTTSVETALASLRARRWIVQDSRGSNYTGRASVYRLGDPAEADKDPASLGVTKPKTQARLGHRPKHTGDTGPSQLGTDTQARLGLTDPLSDPGTDPGSDPLEDEKAAHREAAESVESVTVAAEAALEASPEAGLLEERVTEEAAREAAELTRKIFQDDPWAVSPAEQWANERAAATTEILFPVSTTPQPWETMPDWLSEVPKRQPVPATGGFDPFADYHRPTLGGSYRPATTAGNDPPAGS